MKLVTTSYAAFACHSKACAPPPVGKGGSGAGGGMRPAKLYAKGVKKVTDVGKALDMIRKGRTVQVKSQKQANTLVQELGRQAAAAAASGGKLKKVNLCKVSVPGTNLFCAKALSIPRIEMPQFSGQPKPGSKAAGFPKNDKGGVDGSEDFVRFLATKGVKVKDKTMRASELKASQSELKGAKIARMANDKTFDPTSEPIFVSRDGYIIDGHHRWGTQIVRDLADGHTGDLPMAVRVVDMNIKDVLKTANDWADNVGIERAAA